MRFRIPASIYIEADSKKEALQILEDMQTPLDETMDCLDGRPNAGIELHRQLIEHVPDVD